MKTSVLLVALALALWACGNATGGRASVPPEITGPIIDVDSTGLNEVQSFEVKDGDRVFRLYIDPEVDYGFNLGHLNEHLASGEPVRVDVVERHGKLYARAIVDA